jgi:hypothetical protein
MLVSHLVYSSTLKMEAACFSVMSVDFQRTTRRYIPDDSTLYQYLSEICLHSLQSDNGRSWICGHTERLSFLYAVRNSANSEHSS